MEITANNNSVGAVYHFHNQSGYQFELECKAKQDLLEINDWEVEQQQQAIEKNACSDENESEKKKNESPIKYQMSFKQAQQKKMRVISKRNSLGCLGNNQGIMWVESKSSQPKIYAPKEKKLEAIEQKSKEKFKIYYSIEQYRVSTPCGLDSLNESEEQSNQKKPKKCGQKMQLATTTTTNTTTAKTINLPTLIQHNSPEIGDSSLSRQVKIKKNVGKNVSNIQNNPPTNPFIGTTQNFNEENSTNYENLLKSYLKNPVLTYLRKRQSIQNCNGLFEVSRENFSPQQKERNCERVSTIEKADISIDQLKYSHTFSPDPRQYLKTLSDSKMHFIFKNESMENAKEQTMTNSSFRRSDRFVRRSDISIRSPEKMENKEIQNRDNSNNKQNSSLKNVVDINQQLKTTALFPNSQLEKKIQKQSRSNYFSFGQASPNNRFPVNPFYNTSSFQNQQLTQFQNSAAKQSALLKARTEGLSENTKQAFSNIVLESIKSSPNPIDKLRQYKDIIKTQLIEKQQQISSQSQIQMPSSSQLLEFYSKEKDKSVSTATTTLYNFMHAKRKPAQ